MYNISGICSTKLKYLSFPSAKTWLYCIKCLVLMLSIMVTLTVGVISIHLLNKYMFCPVSPCQPSWANVFSWTLLTLDRRPLGGGINFWKLACWLSTCFRYRGRWFNSNRRQVEMIASRKPGLRICLYLLMQFLSPLMGLDSNGTFVWCGGGRFSPLFTMFHSQYCLGYPLGYIGMT